MKNTFYILLLLLVTLSVQSQKINFAISSQNTYEQRVIDSIGYQKIHATEATIKQTSEELKNQLQKMGYIYATVSTPIFEDKTSAIADATLHTIFENALIYNERIASEEKSGKIEEDSIIIPFTSIESYLENITRQLELEGYSMAKVQLSNFRESGKTLIADLVINKGAIRKISEIVINGIKNFPQGHRKNIERLFKNSTFTQSNIQNIRKEFDKLPFVQQTKNPEILFTTDTTKVYVYLEKANSNRFDGIVGFANDEESSKLIFNGYLDLQLNNALNSGETFELYWKSDGQKQTTFKSNIELPYILKSPFALKANLHIFKQDSTYQNTKTSIEAGFYLTYNKRFFGGYQSTESSDIQNLNSSSIKDYKNSFFTAAFEYIDYKPELTLFPYKTSLSAKIGVGQRTSATDKIPQAFIETNFENNFYLNSKNILWVRNTNYFLQSKEYILGELFRFGGSRSIRGFDENQLQGNMALLLTTEYRYLLSSTLYAHSILDYGYYTDDNQSISANANNSLIGAGIGFGISTKIGLFNISYANGFRTKERLDTQNSIVHISFNTQF